MAYLAALIAVSAALLVSGCGLGEQRGDATPPRVTQGLVYLDCYLDVLPSLAVSADNASALSRAANEACSAERTQWLQVAEGRQKEVIEYNARAAAIYETNRKAARVEKARAEELAKQQTAQLALYKRCVMTTAREFSHAESLTPREAALASIIECREARRPLRAFLTYEETALLDARATDEATGYVAQQRAHRELNR